MSDQPSPLRTAFKNTASFSPYALGFLAVPVVRDLMSSQSVIASGMALNDPESLKFLLKFSVMSGMALFACVGFCLGTYFCQYQNNEKNKNAQAANNFSAPKP